LARSDELGSKSVDQMGGGNDGGVPHRRARLDIFHRRTREMTDLQGLVLFSAVFFGVGIPLVSLFYTKGGRIVLAVLLNIVFFVAFLLVAGHH
jgi:hypothetical protein